MNKSHFYQFKGSTQSLYDHFDIFITLSMKMLSDLTFNKLVPSTFDTFQFSF